VWRFISNKKKSPVSFLILDEVFGELSPSNAQILYNHISGLKKYFSYIFITSHTDHVWQSDYTLSVGT
jgi:ABC-type multidrug transport system ATPase subunit